MNSQDSVYQLASAIAHEELRRGLEENRVKSPDAFMRKVRDNLLERTAQRGSGWLVEQGMRFGVPIPHDLQSKKPTRDEINAKKPAMCPTCGLAVPFDPTREVVMFEGWPFSTKACAIRRRDDFEACRQYQERSELNLLHPIPMAA